MKTITIQDPSEVKELVYAEFKDRYALVNFTANLTWRISVWTAKEHFTGEAGTVVGALFDLREKIAANDPAAKLRKQAEALGMKLVPA